MKPFLKWPGNKYRIKEKIISSLPAGKRLIEPFAGSGAIFLNTNYPKYILGEQNKDLINLYTILQQEGVNFIEYCRKYFKLKNNDAKIYYQLREKFNLSTDSHIRAALFLYLNKHGYNGLCRYNSKGIYNVPFGRYKKPYFPTQEMLNFHEKSNRCQFIYGDFQQTLSKAKPGDVVYCDPPYVPLSATADFSKYTGIQFGEEQQIKLAQLATQIAQRGITVIISNHDTPFTRTQYSEAQIISFQVQRYISCNANLRNKVPELLAVFGTSLG